MSKMEFKKYKRKKSSAEMIFYKDYFGQMDYVSVSEADRNLSNEEFALGYIARNPNNYNDMWYVSKKYFDANFEIDTEVKND